MRAKRQTTAAAGRGAGDIAPATESAAGGPRRGAAKPSRVAEQIRELIVRGHLAPGVHLAQAQLAKQFHVSRVPVREALKLLVAEGLLLHDPNRGFFVATLSRDEARQLYRIRRLIEVELLSSVQWPTAKQLAELERRVDELEALLKADKRAEWAIQHGEFHRAIFNLSSEAVLIREALRLWTLTNRYRSLLPIRTAASGQKGTEDERDLLEALAQHDRRRLLRVFHADRAQVEQMLLSLLAEREL